MKVEQVLLLLTLFFLPKLTNSSVIREEYNDVIATCANDSDCGKEQFCSIETDYCEQCVPCTERFNRQPASNNSCAKIEKDCGYCLLGYVADPWTNERHSSTKCYKPSEKLVSSTNPANKSETPLALTIFSVILVLAPMVALGFFAYFFPKKMIDIRNRISSRKTPDENSIEMMDVESAPKPSAPRAESVREDESAEESEQLMYYSPPVLLNVQENRHCGAVPIGPHHVYHPPANNNGEIAPLIVHESSSNRDHENSMHNIDASETDAAPASMETSPKSNPDELLLFRQISTGDLSPRPSAVPAVFRSASDSDLSNHIRLSHHRPNTTNSSDEPSGSQDQLPTNENTLEVEMAIMVKRNNKNQ